MRWAAMPSGTVNIFFNAKFNAKNKADWLINVNRHSLHFMKYMCSNKILLLLI